MNYDKFNEYFERLSIQFNGHKKAFEMQNNEMAKKHKDEARKLLEEIEKSAYHEGYDDGLYWEEYKKEYIG